MTQESYRPPASPVHDPTPRQPWSLALSVFVGLGVGMVALFALSFVALALVAGRAETTAEATQRIGELPDLVLRLVVVRGLASAIGAWCAARLSRRWLASALWVSGALIAVPVLSFVFSLADAEVFWPSAVCLPGALAGGWLATLGRRQQ